MAQIVVTQTKSTIGEKPKARGAIRALGLGRIGRSRVHEDNKVIRGMIHGVRHLVTVKDGSDAALAKDQ